MSRSTWSPVTPGNPENRMRNTSTFIARRPWKIPVNRSPASGKNPVADRGITPRPYRARRTLTSDNCP
jgi:hypothetical protein